MSDKDTIFEGDLIRADESKGEQIQEELEGMLGESQKRVKASEKINARPKKARTSAINITQKGAESCKPKAKGYRVYDATVTGLFLNVGASGTKSWSLLYTSREGKRQVYRFGSLAQYDVVSARAEGRRLLGEVARGNDPVLLKREAKADAAQAKSRTLRMFLNGGYWNEHLSKNRTGEKDRNRILSAYAEFLDLDMKLLTPAMLNAHRTAQYDAGIKPQTLNRNRTSLHTLLKKAVKTGLIDENPSNKDDHPALDEINAKRVRYLGMKDEHENFEQGERERFMAALATMPELTQAFVGLCMNTALRRGELFTLKWDAVSLAKRTITVHAHYAKGAKRRDIGLNERATKILSDWKKRRGNVLRVDGLVFTSQTGQGLTTIQTAWDNLIRKAQIDHFTFHDIRHDVASRLVMAGVSLYEVAAVLGHSDVKMTMRYAHLAPEQLHKNMELL